MSPRTQPFLYLLVSLVLGILIARQWGSTRWILVAVLCVSVPLTIGLFSNRRPVGTTLALLVGFAAVGGLLSLAESAPGPTPRLKDLFAGKVIGPEQPVELTGWLGAPPEPAPGGCYLDVASERIRVGAESIATSGRVRLALFAPDDQTMKEVERLGLDYGSRLRLLVRLERARTYSNPGSPDFNEFLELQGFDLKGAIKSPLLIERLAPDTPNPVRRLLGRIRLGAMRALDGYFGPNVAGTLKAMLFGSRYYLDPDESDKLREAGTFHVISISGMHVALIAWLLQAGRSRAKRRRILRAGLSIGGLWLYAVMVGLNPPLTRATLMITIGLVGPLLFRRSASINTVSLAGFLMLIAQPSQVADPGFQLSFIAVGAIVALAVPASEKLRAIGTWRPTPRTPHPPICFQWLRAVAETLFWSERAFDEEMRHGPVRYGLEKARGARVLQRLRLQGVAKGVTILVVTSLAIQVATLPLTIFYFNRVAPIGVLLNVVAGLLTGTLMFCGLATLAIGGISGWIVAPLAWLANLSHHLLVNAIEPFRQWPAASFRVANYDGWGAILYFVYFIPLAILVVLIDRWRPVPADLEEHSVLGRSVPHPVGHKARLRPLKPLLSKRGVGLNLYGDRLLLGMRRRASLLCAIAMAAALLVVMKPLSASPNGKLAIHFLDVGQGDSAVVVFPLGGVMVVDGGGEVRFNRRAHPPVSDPSEERTTENEGRDDTAFRLPDGAMSVGEAVVSRFLWSKRIGKIDYVLNTHADLDHLGGLFAVLRNFRVRQVLTGAIPTANPEFEAYSDLTLRNQIPMAMINQGRRFEVEGVTINVLWPPLPRTEPVVSRNNDSVVLRLSYGSVSILLTGDIEQPAEDALVKSGVDLRADVLKVPHHGSKSSSTARFLAAVRPSCAVISVGEQSPFGHPHAAVVNRYLDTGARLFQTGLDGTVTVETDGSEFKITTFKDRTP